ncbi:hypothetical protein GQX73_g3810 [Xylaria multiplex]|uniref:Inosine/uridine-preferring nucleoside hydrolase domain-containing protein n=1 Tax=Xylaria multiplex TaxID=323545 RepID=A0A7C8MVX5_9PEZI|nr:hypothetical protein GQX73_g3810 [Xylaria multiplex]
MPPRNRIIVDTDPGVDDVLALLFALASSPEDLELLMISVSYGNIPVEGCLKNVMSLFQVLQKEITWRLSTGRPEGFESLKTFKPIVAIGPEHGLEEELLAEDGFHGPGGLHGVHESHPHLSPDDTWRSLFQDESLSKDTSEAYKSYFTPCSRPAHLEILRLLREEPEGTISICVIGPMTNIAMAAAAEPETFLRVKELIVMGGAVDYPGNITPVAEFNTYADPTATASVFALTSMTPASTMPIAREYLINMPPYPRVLSKRLRINLFPLELTTRHVMRREQFSKFVAPYLAAGSPLATFVKAFMDGTFRQIEKMAGGPLRDPGLQLHDPMTIWFALTRDDPRWRTADHGAEDIRVETSGQWTRGMHIRDRRAIQETKGSLTAASDDVIGDEFGWLSARKGNQIHRYLNSPGLELLAPMLLGQIFSSI